MCTNDCGSGSLNCDCESSVNTKKLCAKRGKVCWLESKSLKVDVESVNASCAQDLKAKVASVESLAVNNLCAVDANINNLCVSNFRAPNWKPCSLTRAFVGFNADFNYALGTEVNFDAILDDPSGVVSFTPTKFTVPIGGYYDVNLFLNGFNASGSIILMGNPIAHIQLQVNGVPKSLQTVPFLVFNTSFAGSLNAVMLLSAGDVVTAILNILVLDPSSGIIPYVGTIQLNGGNLPATFYPSTMSITLISELCSGDIPCVPCQPSQVECPPVVITGCDPCI